MKAGQFTSFVAFSAILLACTDRAVGDIFGSGANTFEIDFVTIGNPGNADDTVGVANNRPQGGVDYTYRIGKYEISTEMLTKANAEGNLDIFYIDYWAPDQPAYWVSWYGAAMGTERSRIRSYQSVPQQPDELCPTRCG